MANAKMNPKTRSLIIRIAALVLIILLAVLMYIVGKEHTLLVDNRTTDAHSAERFIEVYVDGRQDDYLQLFARDRGQFRNTVMGQKHTIRMIPNYDESRAVEQTVSLPLQQKMFLIDAPAFLAGEPVEVWLQPYEVEVVVSAEDDEEVVLDETSSLSGDF